MSGSFIAVAFFAALALVYWRITLLILVASFVALVLFTLGIIDLEPLTSAAPAQVEAPALIEPQPQASSPEVGPPQPR